MSTPSVEERLSRARGFAALIARMADDASTASPVSPPPKAFWRGLGDLAEQLEAHIVAAQKGLDAKAMDRPAQDVAIER